MPTLKTLCNRLLRILPSPARWFIMLRPAGLESRPRIAADLQLLAR